MTVLSYAIELVFTSGAILEHGQPEGVRYSLICSPNEYGFLAVLIKNRVGKIADFGLK